MMHQEMSTGCQAKNEEVDESEFSWICFGPLPSVHSCMEKGKGYANIVSYL